MPRREPVRVIRQPSSSVSGTDDRLEFIRCVGGRQLQSNKLWSFAEDGSFCQVHPFLRIDVGDFSRYCFQTDCSTEKGRRVVVYGRKAINGSVKWFSIPAPFCDTGVAWSENILVPSPRWGDRVTYATWYLGTQSGVLIGADDTCRSFVLARLAYLPRIPQKCARNCAPCLWRSSSGEPSGAGSKCLVRSYNSAVKGRLIVRMMTGIIFGTNRLINTFCAKFTLVV